MANVPLVRGVLDSANEAIFTSGIRDAVTSLSFGAAPTTEMVQKMYKWGPKSENFVDVAFDNAAVRTDLLPPSFGFSDYEKDMLLVRKLRTLLPSVQQLYELMTGSIMILQSQVMARSTLFYNIVRETYESGMGDLRPLYEELSERFPGGHQEQPVEPVTPEVPNP